MSIGEALWIALGLIGLILVVLGGRRALGRQSGVGAAAGVVMLIVSSPAWVPWSWFGIWTVRCEHMPVLASSYSYHLPGDAHYPVPGFPLLYDYYCSESEAQAHGTSHAPLP